MTKGWDDVGAQCEAFEMQQAPSVTYKRKTPNAKLSGGTPSAQVTCSACGGTGQDDPPPGKYHGLCQKCKGTGKQNATHDGRRSRTVDGIVGRSS